MGIDEIFSIVSILTPESNLLILKSAAKVENHNSIFLYSIHRADYAYFVWVTLIKSWY